MYKELVNRLRLAKAVLSRNKDLIALLSDAADAIDKLVKICNSVLLKYEEAAETVIYEYSGHIDEDIDELRKEIEDYKTQINGVVELPMKEIGMTCAKCPYKKECDDYSDDISCTDFLKRMKDEPQKEET